MYIQRALEPVIQKTSETFPVLMVTGPRQVGKTTTLRRLAESSRRYVSLDNPDARLLANTEPGLFLQRYEPPVLIDEIQYAPQLLPYIKMQVDESREMGRFWLTGSQAFHLMKNVSESLAGRVGIINMQGLSAAEIGNIPSQPFIVDKQLLMARVTQAEKQTMGKVFARIFKGSMPALYNHPIPDREKFYESYVATYLERDVRDLTQVGDLTTFYKFMTVLAAQTARPLIYSEVARDAGISVPTAKRWVSILLASQLIALVQPYSNNLLKRVTKMPLLHFLDTGLCTYLMGWDSPDTLERGPMSGQFFESYVFSEIYKSWLNAGRRPPLFYYRDKDKKEIDLIILRNGVLTPIEVKKTASPTRDATKHFPVLDASRHTPTPEPAIPTLGDGAVICSCDDLLPLSDNNWCVPVWLI